MKLLQLILVLAVSLIVYTFAAERPTQAGYTATEIAHIEKTIAQAGGMKLTGPQFTAILLGRLNARPGPPCKFTPKLKPEMTRQEAADALDAALDQFTKCLQTAK